MRWIAVAVTLATVVGVAALGASAGDTQLRYQQWLGHGNGPGLGFGQGNLYLFGNDHGYGQGYSQGHWPQFGSTTFKAGHGIVCDRGRRACYGPRLDYQATRHFFGWLDAADVLGTPYLYQPDFSSGYGQLFSPRAGILCDRSSRTCADERGLDAHWTGRQFGDSYEEKVEDWRVADAFRPTQGIVCDNRRRVCASARGVENGWTNFVFGRTGNTGYRIIDEPRQPFGGEKHKP
jgi:hypothetical protein